MPNRPGCGRLISLSGFLCPECSVGGWNFEGSLVLENTEGVIIKEGGIMEKSLEELYGLKKGEVDLRRRETRSGKWLEVFKSPGLCIVDIDFPEFTSLCPKTSQPDFANIGIKYIPGDWCVELKSLKYYFNSFRNEGHFYEEVTRIIYEDLKEVLDPIKIRVTADFNTRGGTSAIVEVGDDIE